MTLNLLISLNSPEYFNLVDGATHTAGFLNFFSDSADVVNVFTGRPALDHVKAVLNGYLLFLVNESLRLATAEAIETITSKDMEGFYKHNYLLLVCVIV